jgi:hypothetical protein
MQRVATPGRDASRSRGLSPAVGAKRGVTASPAAPVANRATPEPLRDASAGRPGARRRTLSQSRPTPVPGPENKFKSPTAAGPAKPQQAPRSARRSLANPLGLGQSPLRPQQQQQQHQQQQQAAVMSPAPSQAAAAGSGVKQSRLRQPREYSPLKHAKDLFDSINEALRDSSNEASVAGQKRAAHINIAISSPRSWRAL